MVLFDKPKNSMLEDNKEEKPKIIEEGHPDDYQIEWSILIHVIGQKILRFFVLKEWKKRIVPFIFSVV